MIRAARMLRVIVAVAVLACVALPAHAVERDAKPHTVEATEVVYAWVNFGLGSGCVRYMTGWIRVWGGIWYDTYPYDISAEFVDIPLVECLMLQSGSPWG